jgi:hypothetical protein
MLLAVSISRPLIVGCVCMARKPVQLRCRLAVVDEIAVQAISRITCS